MRTALPAVCAILTLIGAACAGAGETPIDALTPDADGVYTTRSGLTYKVLRQGFGPRPAARDLVLVHYSCTLTDGTVIDSSYERGEPDVLSPRDLIRGFGEALQLMSAGSHFHVTVPGRLGYGWDGLDDQVGPNETLIFEIELFRVEER